MYNFFRVDNSIKCNFQKLIQLSTLENLKVVASLKYTEPSRKCLVENFYMVKILQFNQIKLTRKV